MLLLPTVREQRGARERGLERNVESGQNTCCCAHKEPVRQAGRREQAAAGAAAAAATAALLCLGLGRGARQLLRLRGGDNRLLIAAAASCAHRQGLRGHRCRTLGAMVC